MSGDARINAEVFFKSANVLFSSWEERPDVWKDVQKIFVVSGKSTGDDVFKTSAIHIWLFGYVLSGTAIIFAKPRKVFILTFRKAFDLLKDIQSGSKGKDSFGIEVELVLRNRADKDKANFAKVIDFLAESRGAEVPSVGALLGDEEKPMGDFGVTMYNEHLTAASNAEKYKLVELDGSFSKFFSLKSTEALSDVEEGSVVLSSLFQSAVAKMVKIVEEDKKITHSALSEKIEGYFVKPKRCKLSEEDLDNLDMIYPPMVQSGDHIVLKPFVEVNDGNLDFSILNFAIGARWNGYCSNMMRTFLIDPTEEKKAVYSLLVNLQMHILESLFQHGVALKDIYDGAVEFIRGSANEVKGYSADDLVEAFSSSCGYGMGIEFVDRNLIINSKNEARVEVGMVFCVSVGFEGLFDQKKSRKFSLGLADTVIITRNPEKCARKTTEFNARLSNITYSLEEEEEDSERVPHDVEMDVKKSRSVRERDRGAVKDRIERQRDIYERSKQEAKDMYANLSVPKESTQESSGDYFDALKISAYTSTASFPKELAANMLFVDIKNEVLLCPMNNVPVPFHISTIKNLSKGEEGDFTYLRLNFISGSESGAQRTLKNLDPTKTYIKELTYRAVDGRNLNLVFKQMRELKKRYNQRLRELRTRMNIVKQDDIILNSVGPRVALREVTMRPSSSTRKSVGELQAHMNGMRFVTRAGQKVDILYSNVKHFIFQPAEDEYLTIIHFHLHNPILISKKQLKDIQFIREIGETSHALDRQEGPLFEKDGIEEEQQEIELKNETNQEFETFCDRVQSVSEQAKGGHGLEYESPFVRLGFYGVPHNSTVFMMPTTDCLVSIAETPFYVQSMNEVQVAYFERVDYSLKNFDLVFIPKDIVNTNVVQVNTIPREYLDPVKRWLDKISVSYFEGSVNLNWNAIMNHARSDPKSFFEEGGWDFLKEEEEPAKGGDSSQESDDESAFEISSEPDSDDEEYDSGSVRSSSSEEEPEDEEGLDWDELERKAREEDMKMNYSD